MGQKAPANVQFDPADGQRQLAVLAIEQVPGIQRKRVPRQSLHVFRRRRPLYL